MQEENTKQSRREFLQKIGEIGGTAAVYQAMVSMGLLVSGEAQAGSTRQQWNERSQLLGNVEKPTVAILGGGIAGLCVAYELKKAGFPFYLIEARDRPGGRSHTIRSGSVVDEIDSQQNCNFDNEEELYFNAGPARISQTHCNLLSYCRELGVPLQALVNDNPGAFIHNSSAFGGVPVRAREVKTAIRGYIAELLSKALNAGALDSDISFSEQNAVLDVLRDYGDLSLSNFFISSTRGGLQEDSGGLTPGLANPALNLDDFFFDTSVPFTPNFSESINQSATMMQPVGGMDKIAQAFADEVVEEAYYGIEITAIRRSGSRVLIEGRADGMEGAAEVDYAIVAIPPSVLRNIPNDFSPAAANAIAQVQYANPTKIAFQSPRFWESEDDIYGGISWTDPEILQIWYPSGGFGQEKGIIVGSYLFGGTDATNFQNLSISDRIEFALAGGEKVHPQYRQNLSAGVSVAWAKVPYSLGGWSVSTPSSLLQLPDGPFLFAGDHLTYLQGWQEGAVISSLNALNNLLDLMGV
ncbi:MAG: FAD-dependent oxidoreductase [Pseudomonadales bacterium]|nr:FAD-dependent oxidoreductase [Pseudomonadales bacterium]